MKQKTVKEYNFITESDWWKNKSNSRGLPKGHPFLNRENDASTKREVIKEIGDTEPENSDKENGISSSPAVAVFLFIDI